MTIMDEKHPNYKSWQFNFCRAGIPIRALQPVELTSITSLDIRVMTENKNDLVEQSNSIIKVLNLEPHQYEVKEISANINGVDVVVTVFMEAILTDEQVLSQHLYDSTADILQNSKQYSSYYHKG